MAEMTERVEFGTLVMCNSYRNPNLLADMSRFVDHISNGKLLLGLGNSWFRKNYDEYGYPFGTAGERPRTLDQRCTWSRRSGAYEPATGESGYWVDRGGGGKVTLRIVAEYAHIWNGLSDPREAA